ncbi:ABC transporter permease subunit [Nakamurella sp. YIM 132087]|uniref:ABC transporter permease subunit n=1 Tax=Nakamurella alba TaxID=2665158 RepID=A0A7K1FE58_9ACTN|nr:ABC transporter permease [Nakamurella alba]MTD12366.1 ABC transporter permease subunit [Nakamurella alba]
MSSVLRALAKAVITLWIAVTIAFFLARIAGDPAARLAGEFATPATLQRIREQLGLADSLLAQYVRFLGELVRGDLGDSFSYHVSNVSLIASRLPASLTLAISAMVIAVVIGVPLGVLAAAREGSVVDRVVSVLSLVGQSVPTYWIGLMGITVFAVTWGLLPAGGNASFSAYILPAVAVAFVPLAAITRLTRSSMIEALQQDFFSAGLARGLSRPRLIWRHALRHTALPVLTVIGLQTGLLLSGTVTAEVVFSWPGLGRLVTDAVQQNDFPLVQAVVIVGALVFVVVNLLVDLSYPALDPRLRRGKA